MSNCIVNGETGLSIKAKLNNLKDDVFQSEYSLTYSAKDVGMLEDRLHVNSVGSIWIGEQAFNELKYL